MYHTSRPELDIRSHSFLIRSSKFPYPNPDSTWVRSKFYIYLRWFLITIQIQIRSNHQNSIVNPILTNWIQSHLISLPNTNNRVQYRFANPKMTHPFTSLNTKARCLTSTLNLRKINLNRITPSYMVIS